MKILVTGAAGFIAGYVVAELLRHGHHVVGIDNFSKYGPVAKAHDSHPNYRFVFGDCKDVALMTELAADCDHFVAGAAMIGGISYFHAYAYDLISENEHITAAAFDAAIWAHKNARLRKITVISLHGLRERDHVPHAGNQIRMPAALFHLRISEAGIEYFALGAWQQYGLPYTIVRPFNCVGIGEGKALGGHEPEPATSSSACPRGARSCPEILKGQDPLRILGKGNQVRYYTYGGDLARGIRMSLESDKAVNDDFNLSTAASTTVLDLAKLVWKKINGGKPFRFTSDAPYDHDVQVRVPDVTKAERLLGFSAEVPIRESVREVVGWVRAELNAGRL